MAAKTEKTKNTYMMGSFLLIWGVAIIGLELLIGIEGSWLALMLGAGLILLWLGIYLIRNVFRCNERVEAKFVKCNVYHSRGATFYAPVFQYYFNGIQYERETQQRFSNWFRKKNFKVDGIHEIYICPKAPEVNILKRRIRFSHLFSVVFGGFCIAVSVLIWMQL